MAVLALGKKCPFFESFVEGGSNTLSCNLQALDVNSIEIINHDDEKKYCISIPKNEAIKKEMCRLSNLLDGNMTKKQQINFKKFGPN